MKDLNPLLPECRKMLRQGANTEAVLLHLRKSGVNKALSIVALDLLGVAPLNDGKLLVHNSATWADVRERDEKFHEDLLREATILSEKNNN